MFFFFCFLLFVLFWFFLGGLQMYGFSLSCDAVHVTFLDSADPLHWNLQRNSLKQIDRMRALFSKECES